MSTLTTHSDSRVEKVLVMTSDSRTLVGTMLSYDQMTNLVLSETIERIIRPPDDPEPSSEIPHGLYLIRGDNVVVVGLVDEELDDSISWLEVRGAVIGGVKHS
ncbi:U6 snRNA-associated Sm-like protein [Lachnellula willkommii]|uniref:LSM2-LSM8 complex subunit LSM8 n=2 Tax=Lachnellula TaxID=47830 RepID=A0A7D8YLV2_9HELO|nr:U6 snRNA-associated Sm-like protein LSm8 [Lachnellula cervina]TVY91445.1 U6 snRNA-associated Sm-like protein [Lachnellula willkommii]